MGDELPRSGNGTFHRMFLVLLHSVGRFLSGVTLLPSGPRHSGQLADRKGRIDEMNTHTARATEDFMATTISRNVVLPSVTLIDRLSLPRRLDFPPPCSTVPP